MLILEKESPKINNLPCQCKKLENKEKIISKASRKKELIKIRAEISEIKNRNTVEKNQ